MEFLQSLCDRYQLVMIGAIAPQRPEQIGHDKEEDFLALAKYYADVGFQVVGAESSGPQLRYPAGPYFKSEIRYEPLVGHAREMVSVARDLVDLHLKSHSKSTLIGACLTINHVIDWVHARKSELGEKVLASRKFRAAFGKANPRWEAICNVATGIKHPGAEGLRLEIAHLEWEDDDWFTPIADVPVWFVNVEGRRRALVTLCLQFLDNFEKLFPNL